MTDQLAALLRECPELLFQTIWSSTHDTEHPGPAIAAAWLYERGVTVDMDAVDHANKHAREWTQALLDLAGVTDPWAISTHRVVDIPRLKTDAARTARLRFIDGLMTDEKQAPDVWAAIIQAAVVYRNTALKRDAVRHLCATLRKLAEER